MAEPLDPFNVLENPDHLFGLLLSGLRRVEQRWKDNLNTVYVDAPQIEDKKDEPT